MPGTTWSTLHERALDRYGYVTTDDAREEGIDPTYLRLMGRRGTIEHVGYGLYRFPQVPVTEHTHLMEAVLWVGDGAVLSHDSVLSMHGLANANPSIVRVTTPRRVRKSGTPSPIEIIRRPLPGEDLTVYNGIPSTTVARALLDCRELIMRSRLLEAAHEARSEGLIRRHAFDALLAELARQSAGHRPAPLPVGSRSTHRGGRTGPNPSQRRHTGAVLATGS